MLRASEAPLLDILTSQSGRNPSYFFAHFVLKMRFVPQLRESFPHPNFVCFVHFDVKKASLRSSVHFCTVQFPKVVRDPRFVNSFRTRRFSVDPRDLQIIGKQCFETFLTFRTPVSSFFHLRSSDSSTLLFSAFHLSILSEFEFQASFDR